MAERACPICCVPLEGRSVTSKYGAAMIIDCCPSCRGIWFDRNELYIVGKQQVEELASSVAEGGGQAVSGGSRCPGCGSAMIQPSGINKLPGTTDARYCGDCGGFWLSEHDLIEFHRFRERRFADIRKEEEARRAREVEYRREAYADQQRVEPGDTQAGAAVLGAALAAMGGPAVGPLAAIGITLAEHLAPMVVKIIEQKVEERKDVGRALPKANRSKKRS